MEPRKILILSSNNGGGHNTAGRAIREAAAERGIWSEMLDGLAFDAPWKSRAVADIHVKGALYAPELFAIGNALAERPPREDHQSLCYRVNARYAEKVYHYLCERRIDAVICTHVFPALAMTEIKRTWRKRFPAFFAATDYSCAPYVNETELDGCFIPHPALRHEFIDAHVPYSRLFPTGIPVARKFSEHMDRQEARRRLDLPAEPAAVLVMTGSMGFGDVPGLLLELLKRLPEEALLLVLGGNNEKLKETLRAEFSPCGNVRVLDFTQEVELYMDASDLLISKPGGLSTTEAAVRGIPLIHTTPIPGWEERNVAFFRERGLSLYGATAQEAAEQAVWLLEHPEEREAMVARQRAEINPHAAGAIVETVAAKCGWF